MSEKNTGFTGGCTNAGRPNHEEVSPEQARTPLLEALRTYIARRPAYFRIPAHRFSRGVDGTLLQLLGEEVFSADLTEAEGLDDLHAPDGAIAEAERLAAALWGSEACHFLVNGSTCGNEAMLLACLQPGDEVLLARNVHKSVLMGLVLSGAVPVWLNPGQLAEGTLDGPVSAADVAHALREHPACRAVMLVSPTYYGVCSPIREIAEVCHKRQIPLLVDEAHGSHLYFLPGACGAVTAGADLVVQSLHKTGGSMTQSSLLHVQGELVDRRRLKESLSLVMSTSPSYVLMASLDGARHQLALRGRELMAQAARLAEHCRQELRQIPGITLPVIPQADPLRLVFSAVNGGISGTKLQEYLYEVGGISLELSDPVYVVAVLTWGNTEEDVDRLLETVRCVMAGRAISKRNAGRNTSSVSDSGRTYSVMRHEVACAPREAWYAETEPRLLEDSCGCTAGESVTPYPPGIPLLYPGERITPDILQALYEVREAQIPLHGPADKMLRTIRVLQEETGDNTSHSNSTKAG